MPLIVHRPPAGFCVSIMCGHLEDNPGHLTSQQRQSPLSDNTFFQFYPLSYKEWINVSVIVNFVIMTCWMCSFAFFMNFSCSYNLLGLT